MHTSVQFVGQGYPRQQSHTWYEIKEGGAGEEGTGGGQVRWVHQQEWTRRGSFEGKGGRRDTTVAG
jgi:hypothetical protein